MIWLGMTVFFTAALLGFAVGRQCGRREGFALGMAYAPLQMRTLVLLRSKCPVCGQEP